MEEYQEFLSRGKGRKKNLQTKWDLEIYQSNAMYLDPDSNQLLQDTGMGRKQNVNEYQGKKMNMV